MTLQYAKPIRKKLRELAGLAVVHYRGIGGHLTNFGDAIFT